MKISFLYFHRLHISIMIELFKHYYMKANLLDQVSFFNMILSFVTNLFDQATLKILRKKS